MSSTPLLETLFKSKYLSDLDHYLASALGRIAQENDPLVLLGAAVACKATTMGHVCADLEAIVSRAPQDDNGKPIPGASWPSMKQWLQALHGSKMVGDGEANSPIVLENDRRLYLGKYWDLQRRLVKAVRVRIDQPGTMVPDEELLKKGIERWFEPPGDETNWQKVAGATALLKNFSVISGGPGTGKTTTVVKILALLLEQSREYGSDLLIDLLAPTGKAAARLEESVRSARATDNNLEDLFGDSICKASTIHRRLGYGRRGPGSFLHDEKNPIGSDVVIVDEASMVDLALMTRLLEAVPSSSRLILLGDEHQLASVEAGAILGDICNCGEECGWTPGFSKTLESLTGESLTGPVALEEATLADCIVELRKSYRFAESSGIGNVSRMIRDGNAEEAVKYLSRGDHEDLTVTSPDELYEAAREPVLQGYRDYLEKTDPDEKLKALGKFRILCAHRHGPHGVGNLNWLVEFILEQEGLIERAGDWYPGRPIMVTENDYQLGLFNGDIGLITIDENDDETLRANFPDSEGGIRSFSPARLPAHETVYATTIHKSQGSEFDRVLIVLPNSPSALLSRELLYTAITRAKKEVLLFGEEEIISAAIEKRIERASGLRDALWGKK